MLTSNQSQYINNFLLQEQVSTTLKQPINGCRTFAILLRDPVNSFSTIFSCCPEITPHRFLVLQIYIYPTTSNIIVRSGKISQVRSVRIFNITTETTSDNITPFLKHMRETVDTDTTIDTNSVEWKRIWMNDLIRNILKSIHDICWKKIRMLANLNTDYTTK